MNRSIRLLLMLLLIVTGDWKAPAQQPVTEEFVSIAGRFGIILPPNYDEHKPLQRFEILGQNFNGSTYKWSLDSDQVAVSYADGPINLEAPLQADAFLKAISDSMQAAQGPIISEKKTSLEGHPGLIFVVPSGQSRTMVWAYLVRNRFYLLLLSLNDAGKMQDHVKILSSFRILSNKDLEPRYWQLVEKFTPLPLPQEPRPKKSTSDSQDSWLKGKVKRVVTEQENYFGTSLPGVRTRETVDDYDEQGDLTKSVISFDFLPHAVRVHGFLNGQRTFRELVRLPDVRDAGTNNKQPIAESRNQIHIVTIKYKYNEAGQPVEKRVVQADGKELGKYVYSPKEKRWSIHPVHFLMPALSRRQYGCWTRTEMRSRASVSSQSMCLKPTR